MSRSLKSLVLAWEKADNAARDAEHRLAQAGQLPSPSEVQEAALLRKRADELLEKTIYAVQTMKVPVR